MFNHKNTCLILELDVTQRYYSYCITIVQLKCTEAIEAYIERVKEVNPVINAVVQSRFDSALKEAADVDLHLASTVRTSEEIERDQPLLGVPVTIKESIPVAGW